METVGETGAASILGIFAPSHNRAAPRRDVFRMPELPEVEITRRGIAPHVTGRTITGVVVRHRGLRWPVSSQLARQLTGARIRAVDRRAKYLLLDCGKGTLIIHLGMSGSLKMVQAAATPGPHDHFDLCLGRAAVRLRDPRRFGAVLWQAGNALSHPLLCALGIEPLSEAFTGEHLWDACRGRRVAVKQLLMNHAVVVGVGNIYASESLFRARVHPATAAQRLSKSRCERIVAAIKATLEDALAAGGSTLQDFVNPDGERGYFQNTYFVYGRGGEPCRICAAQVRRAIQGQRSTYYCPTCQR